MGFLGIKFGHSKPKVDNAQGIENSDGKKVKNKKRDKNNKNVDMTRGKKGDVNKPGNAKLKQADEEFMNALEAYKNKVETEKLARAEQSRAEGAAEADKAGITGEKKDAYMEMKVANGEREYQIHQEVNGIQDSDREALIARGAQDVANGEKVFFYRDENGKLGPNPKFAAMDDEMLNEVLKRAEQLKNQPASPETQG